MKKMFLVLLLTGLALSQTITNRTTQKQNPNAWIVTVPLVSGSAVYSDGMWTFNGAATADKVYYTLAGLAFAKMSAETTTVTINCVATPTSNPNTCSFEEGVAVAKLLELIKAEVTCNTSGSVNWSHEER